MSGRERGSLKDNPEILLFLRKAVGRRADPGSESCRNVAQYIMQGSQAIGLIRSPVRNPDIEILAGIDRGLADDISGQALHQLRRDIQRPSQFFIVVVPQYADRLHIPLPPVLGVKGSGISDQRNTVVSVRYKREIKEAVNLMHAGQLALTVHGMTISAGNPAACLAAGPHSPGISLHFRIQRKYKSRVILRSD